MKKKRRRWPAFIKQLYFRFNDDNVSALSAQLAFYLLLSVFPFLLFLINLLSFASIPYEYFVRNVNEFLPADINTLLREIVSETVLARSPALLSVGALVTVWSASHGIDAIRKGLNQAYDSEEKRPFWKVRGLAILFTVGIALIILTTLLFLITGRAFGEYLFGFFNASYAFGGLWELLRYIVPLTIMIFVFSLFYKCIPDRKIRLKEVLPGALFATLGWFISSLLFSFYLDHFDSYTRVYGSIGGIIILLVWLYISSVIILLGGEMNATAAYLRSDKYINKYENFKINIPLITTKTRK